MIEISSRFRIDPKEEQVSDMPELRSNNCTLKPIHYGVKEQTADLVADA